MFSLHLAIRTLALCAMLITITPKQSFAQESPTGSVAITVVACPDGIDPRETSDRCTQSRNLPRDTRISLQTDDGQRDIWVKSLSNASVSGDTWTVTNVPADVPLTLAGVEPQDYTWFHVDGTTGTQEFGWNTTFTLEPDETRVLTVYVWNGADGPVQPSENTLTVRTFACPAGIDPGEDHTACTTAIAAPEGLFVTGVSRGLNAIRGPVSNYESAFGTYRYTELPAYTMVSISFFDVHETGYDPPAISGTHAVYNEDYHLVHLVRGENREVIVYFPLDALAPA